MEILDLQSPCLSLDSILLQKYFLHTYDLDWI